MFGGKFQFLHGMVRSKFFSTGSEVESFGDDDEVVEGRSAVARSGRRVLWRDGGRHSVRCAAVGVTSGAS